MNAAALLRAAAIASALTAFLDPGCTVTRDAPLSVLVRPGSIGEPAGSVTRQVRQRLASALEARIDLDSPAPPAAVVLAGPVTGIESLQEDVPISLVGSADGARPDVRVTGVSVPPVLLAGMTGSIAATVRAAGAAGQTSDIVLEHQGVTLGRIEHAWTADDEIFEARFAHVPPAPGVRAMRIVARPLEREAVIADNHADLRLMVQDRRLRILVYEPRPSWSTAFIRRALEEDPIFEVASLARPSRGVAVRAGQAPARFRPDALERFDAVVVGAPEELRQDDVDALSHFARQRGGTFVLAPDRRPSGAYLALIPAASFQERLLESAVRISAGAGSLRSSELVVPAEPGPSIEAIAGLEETAGSPAPVVFGWPVGAGRGVFSGALDAWRHRARGEEFGSFWRARIAAAALASPSPVEAAVEPGTGAPGEPIALTVRVRPTEARPEGRTIEFPAVSAQLTRPDGAVEPIRVWPHAEPGVFEGRLEAPAEGTYLIRASIPGASFETALVVSGGARAARAVLGKSARLLAGASGGVAATVDDLAPLVAHLDSLPAAPAARAVHPTRSPWWMAGVVALMCAEWTLRRRRGQR